MNDMSNNFISLLSTTTDPFTAEVRPLYDAFWNENVNESPPGIELTLSADYEYNFTIEWGDGSSDHITTYDDAARFHIYPAVPGEGTFDAPTRNITITGSAPLLYIIGYHAA